jgi:hypothetical protein
MYVVSSIFYSCLSFTGVYVIKTIGFDCMMAICDQKWTRDSNHRVTCCVCAARACVRACVVREWCVCERGVCNKVVSERVY